MGNNSVSKTFTLVPIAPGVWVTEKTYAATYVLNRQSLANWRMGDRRAGRTCARLGYPQYRYFGRTVRYRLEAEDSQQGEQASSGSAA
jgi:hypothetical protein